MFGLETIVAMNNKASEAKKTPVYKVHIKRGNGEAGWLAVGGLSERPGDGRDYTMAEVLDLKGFAEATGADAELSWFSGEELMKNTGGA